VRWKPAQVITIRSVPALDAGPSRAALVTAVARDLHRQEPPPLVLDDALALQLAGEEGLSLRDRLRAEVRADDLLAFSRWVCVRSRYTEDIVGQQAGTGVGQYVILGAGLDTFAYRRPGPGLRVFEVDHPATQAWKRRRLADLGVAIPGNLVFVPVDFECQGLWPALEEAGFTFAEPAVFSWLGVTMYLTRDAIGQTLSTIARAADGTRVVLTYNQPDRVLDDHAVRVTSAMRSIAAGFGEPFVTLFTREEIDALLREHGFDPMEHVGRDEARARYFGGRQDVEIAGAQALVSAMVVRRPRSAKQAAERARIPSPR
jgi:methyltransferase (TIGR00027 family)